MIAMAFQDKQQSKIFNKKNLIGGIIVLIMVSSILGVFQGNTLTTKYNKFRIKQDLDANKYLIKVEGKEYSFDFHPKTVEVIPLEQDIIPLLKQGKMQYLTFNPDSNLISEIEYTRLNLEKLFPESFSIYLSSGVTNQTAAYAMLPLITCINATDAIKVIEIKQGNETKVYIKNNCIIWEAQDNFGLREIKERIMYGMLGVIE